MSFSWTSLRDGIDSLPLPAFTAFLCFCFYTTSDTLASNGVSTYLSEYFIAPYDIFSIGMLCSLSVSAVSGRIRQVFCGPVLLAISGTLLTLSPLYAVFGMPETVVVILAFLGGSGKGVIVFNLGRVLSSLNYSSRVITVSTAIALAECGCFFLPSTPMLFPVIALICAPICTICIARVCGTIGIYSGRRGVSDWRSHFLFKGDFDRIQIIKLALLVVLACVANAVCFGYAQRALENTIGLGAYVVFGEVVAPLSICAVCLLWLRDRKWMAVCYKAMPVAVSFCILLGVCPSGFAVFPYAIVSLSYAAFSVLFWTAAPQAWRIQGRGTEIGGGFAILALAQCFGFSIACAAFYRGGAIYYMEIAAYVLVISFFAITMFIRFPWSFDGRQEMRVSDAGGLSRAQNEALKEVATESGLSSREFEVLVLLARGRDSKTIQKKLDMAPSTVSTHVQRIYKKMGLHSKQDIIDLIEERTSS